MISKINEAVLLTEYILDLLKDPEVNSCKGIVNPE